MKIHLHIDEELEDVEIHIYGPQYNEQIDQLMKKLRQQTNEGLIGYIDENIHLIKLEDIYSIYTYHSKLFLQTDEEEFECKQKLYELEEKYKEKLIRVNKSTLIHIDKISHIQSKLIHNPLIILSNDTSFEISRVYFKLLKERLGLRRDSNENN